MVWAAGATLTAAQLNANAPQEWTAWTPTVSASSGSFSSLTAVARYARHGKTVVWFAKFTINTVGTASVYLQFTLPVNAVTQPIALGSGRVLAGSVSNSVQVFALTAGVARVSKYDDSTVIGTGNVIDLFGTYESA